MSRATEPEQGTMRHAFDREIPRAGTHSVKWEFVSEGDRNRPWDRTRPELGEQQVLPMWIADMDFRCPEPVIEALQARAAHGIFGYADKTDSYLEALAGWLERRHGWRIQPEWVVTTPGVVPALHFAVRELVGPGEKVLLQGPVYYPFYRAVHNNEREHVSNSLVPAGRRYVMDEDDLAARLADPAVTLAILCNPHNPVGRAWTEAELGRFAELCLANDVVMIADEIHADLTLPGHRFVPLASLGEEVAARTITCTSASKAFNMAGLHTSNIIISEPELRRRFYRRVRRQGLFGMNTFGIVATEAAYRHGDDWLDAVVAYIAANHEFCRTRMRERLPALAPYPLEATYLLWFDCRGLGLDRQGLSSLIFDKARLYLDAGHVFGPEGEGHQRMNIACPRSLLARAMDRLEAAVASL